MSQNRLFSRDKKTETEPEMEFEPKYLCESKDHKINYENQKCKWSVVSGSCQTFKYVRIHQSDI